MSDLLKAKNRAGDFADSALLAFWFRIETTDWHTNAALKELRDLRSTLDAAEAELLAMLSKPEEDVA
jgi:hypothetical protein